MYFSFVFYIFSFRSDVLNQSMNFISTYLVLSRIRFRHFLGLVFLGILVQN